MSQLSFHSAGGAVVVCRGYTCSDDQVAASDATRAFVTRALLLERGVGDALLRICPGSCELMTRSGAGLAARLLVGLASSFGASESHRTEHPGKRMALRVIPEGANVGLEEVALLRDASVPCAYVPLGLPPPGHIGTYPPSL